VSGGPFPVADDDEEELRRLGLHVVLVPHCHGHVALVDPATMTVYLSTEYDDAARDRAFARAVASLRNRLPRRPIPRSRPPQLRLAT